MRKRSLPPEPEQTRRDPSKLVSDWRIIRDVAICIVALIGVIHETYFTNFDRPALLALFGAMMGLVAYLRANGHGK